MSKALAIFGVTVLGVSWVAGVFDNSVIDLNPAVLRVAEWSLMFLVAAAAWKYVFEDRK